MSGVIERQRINPIELITALSGEPPDRFDWIKFNPALNRQYRIRRQSAHDGTQLFTRELLANCVKPIIEMSTCCALDIPQDWAKIERIEYEVGWIWLLTTFGTIDVPAGRIPGCRQRAVMRVRASLIPTPSPPARRSHRLEG